MLIALDYDDTYTADPELWLQFVRDAQRRGHTVLCATMRYKHEGVDMDPRLLELVEVQFTDRRAKLPTLASRSIRPDIWIDDHPSYIVSDSAYSKGIITI